MRIGAPRGAPVTDPIVAMLPSIFQDEHFLGQFLAGFDDVLAPVIATLDCLHAYVDPAVAPDDFVEWLGQWVGLTLEEDWSEARRRRLVAQAAQMYARRGTVGGLRQEVELYTDGRVAIVEPGGVETSRRPSSDVSPRAQTARQRTVRVTVDVDDASTVNWNGLRALVRDAVPAHLPVEVELCERMTDKGERS